MAQSAHRQAAHMSASHVHATRMHTAHTQETHTKVPCTPASHMCEKPSVLAPSEQSHRSVYLDYAAATPLDPKVLEAMLPYFSEVFYNPSAAYQPARAVRQTIDQARARIGALCGARGQNIIFTAGATEANNLALTSVTGKVFVDAAEHDSILAAARVRDHYIGSVCADGMLHIEELVGILSELELISVELANGEVGTIQPIREISQLVSHERMRRLAAGDMRPLYLHTDASQAAGFLSVQLSSLGVDMMTLSAAKMYGPKQMGLLWVREGIQLHPLILGGGQEAGLRSGTENVPGIMGFATAFEIAVAARKSEAARLCALTRRIRKTLATDTRLGAVFLGPNSESQRLPHLVSVAFSGLEARRLLIGLEDRGVFVATGSACAASKMQVSHVLRALGVDDAVARGSIRITLGRQTTEQDVTYALDALREVVLLERA